MQGLPTVCSRCGAQLQKFGCPSYYDICADRERCVTRLLEQNQKLIDRIQELLKKSSENNQT